MKRHILFFFLTISLCPTLRGQDLKYAHDVVDTLAGDYMKGRGYVEDGSKRAASYISAEFKRLGLKPLSKEFFQKFNTPINTFPGKMELKLNGNTLVPGKDFLVEAGSPSVSGKYKTVVLKVSDLLNGDAWVNKVRSAVGKFVIVDKREKSDLSKDELKTVNEIIGFLKYHPDNPAEGTIVVSNDKLTWGGSTQLLSKPSFTVNSDMLDKTFKSVNLKVENKFHKSYQLQNVIGSIEGDDKDSVLVFSAHFDHLGMMGEKTIFPGANDNASGISMLLNLAKYYAANKPAHTIVFIAFAGEELGLLGSKYYTDHPLTPLNKIKFLINFDIAGTGDDGIQIVNGKVYRKEFDMISQINEEAKLLPQVKIRGEACNSDHCFFYQKGVPSFFIYTLGGIQAYHDIYDRAETLPLTQFESYFKLIQSFVARL